MRAFLAGSGLEEDKFIAFGLASELVSDNIAVLNRAIEAKVVEQGLVGSVPAEAGHEDLAVDWVGVGRYEDVKDNGGIGIGGVFEEINDQWLQ